MTRGRRTPRGFRPSLVRLETRDTPTVIGGLDPRFDNDGKLVLPTDASFSDVATLPDGRTVIVGTTSGTGGVNTDFLVARLLPDGTLDETFGDGGQVRVDFAGLNDFAQSVALRSDGTIVVAGQSSTAGFVSTDTSLARIGTDGSILNRTTVAIGGPGVFDAANAVAVNPETGDAYAVGFTSTAPYVARFGPELALVGTIFLPAPFSSVSGVDVGGDGRVFVGGTSFTGGVTQMAAARLNADLGGLVTNTAIAPAFTSDIAVDPVTSRAYLVGQTTGVATQGLVVALNGDLGEVGRTLLDFGGLSSAQDVAVDSRGRVVIAGTANQGGTSADFAVARLLPDGLRLDPSFDEDGKQTINVTANDFVRAVAVGPENAVTVLGSTQANPGAPGATFNPALVRLIGSLELPAPLLTSGPPNGNGELFTLPDPNAARENQTEYETPGQVVELIPGLDKNVRVAVADVNGDGVLDFIAGAGPGVAPRVRVVDGKTGDAIADFFAFEQSFTGGVYVAAGDLDGDGKAEVVVTPDQTGGPVVAIYSGAKLTAGEATGALGGGAQIIRYFGIVDPDFRGGARAAVGDVNNDGVPDLVVSAGFLGGPRITIWDGKQLLDGNTVQLANFFAFEESVRNGAFVGVGDVNGDGFADPIFGGGPTGGPRVRVASGNALMAGPITSLDTATTAGLQIANFIVGDPASRGGIRVAAKDVDGDNLADIVAGSGDNLAANAYLFLGDTIKASGGNPAVDQILSPFGNAVLTNGVFVG